MIVATIPKNETEQINVSIEEFRSSIFVDLRVYWKSAAGEWKPSKKGIALNAKAIGPVIEALEKASAALEG
jgi:hypothetical protein